MGRVPAWLDSVLGEAPREPLLLRDASGGTATLSSPSRSCLCLGWHKPWTPPVL